MLKGHLLTALPQDLFHNVLSKPALGQDYIFSGSCDRPLVQNPFAWEPPMEKTTLEWSNGSSDMLLSVKNAENNYYANMKVIG